MSSDTTRIYVAFFDRVLTAERTGGDATNEATTADWTVSERLVGTDLECLAAAKVRPDRAFAGTAGVGVQRTTDDGNTVVVIEHELDLLKNADHVVDLGPEGGENGGELVAAGTPEEVARTEASHTGQYLRDLLPDVDLEGPRGDRVVTAESKSRGEPDAETAPRADDD